MRKKSHERVPRPTELILPTFQALKELGGSGKNDEILACVIQNLHLPDAMVDLPHNGRASLSELAYRLAWARTYLKTYGVIENSSRCVWSILPEYTQVETLDVKRIVQAVVHRNVELQQNQPMDSGLNDEPEDEGVDVPDEVKPWRQRLQEILQTMDPTDLNGSPNASCANVGSRKSKLQKSPETESSTAPGNFVSTVFFSFNVAFQCKRYSGMVGAGDIRDFRGSLNNNIEKGLFITTGTFSKAAKLEAVDPGKRLIDLLDGEELIDKIVECNIGIHEVRDYEIDEEFFKKI